MAPARVAALSCRGMALGGQWVGGGDIRGGTGPLALAAWVLLAGSSSWLWVVCSGRQVLMVYQSATSSSCVEHCRCASGSPLNSANVSGSLPLKATCDLFSGFMNRQRIRSSSSFVACFVSSDFLYAIDLKSSKEMASCAGKLGSYLRSVGQCRAAAPLPASS